jgi:hypothetical protein
LVPSESIRQKIRRNAEQKSAHASNFFCRRCLQNLRVDLLHIVIDIRGIADAASEVRAQRRRMVKHVIGVDHGISRV